jgi:hypothetical protein
MVYCGLIPSIAAAGRRSLSFFALDDFNPLLGLKKQ